MFIIQELKENLVRDKLVFDGTVTAEYSLTKNVSRRRAARHAEKNKAAYLFD
jgi:hypothetical protein